jgi:hypothetical protein
MKIRIESIILTLLKTDFNEIFETFETILTSRVSYVAKHKTTKVSAFGKALLKINYNYVFGGPNNNYNIILP